MIGARSRGKIRPPRKSLANNENVDFEASWAILASSLREIHTKNASQLSFEQLYRNAYGLVLKKQGEALYNNVKNFEKEWLLLEVHPRVLSVLSPVPLLGGDSVDAALNTNEKRIAGEKLMRALKNAWEDHNLCTNMTSDVLMYLDRVYCTDNRIPSIFVTSMGQFRDYVLRAPVSPNLPNSSVVTILISVILDQIRMERDGDVVDKALIRSCIYMLEGLYEDDDEDEYAKLYLTEFEPIFLSASEDFYRAEGKHLLRTVDAGSYCRHVQRRISEEMDRCRSTLSMLTLEKIKVVIDDELVKDYMREVIGLPGSGVEFMLDNDRLDELQMVYNLVSRIDPKKQDLREAVQKRVIQLGTAINAATTSQTQAKPTALSSDKVDGEGKTAPERSVSFQISAAIQWVDAVLQLKGKYDTVLVEAFLEDQVLQTAISRSFTDFINVFERSSEYLSLFFDENMKKGIKGKTEDEVDNLLDRGITLLRYVQDKDMFERYYKKHLARRLLMKKSISMDAERQMISKMKAEVGNTFTQRIEAMFKDIALSEDLSENYRRHIAGLGAADLKRADLEINVLTSTIWPLESMGSTQRDGESISTCILPPAIETVKQGFENFYLGKHNGRQLTWKLFMGSADVRAYFPKAKSNVKTRELNVPLYASVILLLFNDLPIGASLSCEEIQGRTNIPMNELTRNLQSLAVAKYRVLLKEPMSKDIKPTDKFFFNESFTSPAHKIKIGLVSSGNKVEDQEERKETEDKNNDTRNGLIDATLVRIMKQRKELSHQMLLTEVIQQLTSRFLPDVTSIKKCIESLIEREYLERSDEGERAAYRYLA